MNNWKQNDPYLENIRLPINSEKWLKINSLKSQKLHYEHIISKIGFKNKEDFVEILNKPVSSRYGQRLFKKIPYKHTFYNLTTSKEGLKLIERRLKRVIQVYNDRIEWLTTGSRKVFGVLEDKSICVIIDACTRNQSLFQTYVDHILSLLKEQSLYRINIVRACSESIKWKPHGVEVSQSSVADAVGWLMELPSSAEYSDTAVLESLLSLHADAQLQAVYLLTDGSLCRNGKDLLLDQIKSVFTLPLHISLLKKKSADDVKFLYDFATEFGGKFHYVPPLEARDKMFLTQDLKLVWKELEEARNSLTDIQYLILQQSQTADAANENAQHPVTQPNTKDLEVSISSKEWLSKVAGLTCKNLLLNKYLRKHVVNECTKITSPRQVEDTTHNEDENDFCKAFAHIRNRDIIKHVFITKSIYEEYKEKITKAKLQYEKRLNWLNQGSREIFGNITGNKVAVVVDSSVKMNSFLDTFKVNISNLLQEQLMGKTSFNIVRFDRHVYTWKDEMMNCCAENINEAISWIKGMYCDKCDQNIVCALKWCYEELDSLDAIYLVTTQLPGQMGDEVLSTLSSEIPVHTISYNCTCTSTNHLLQTISKRTNARFYRFIESGNDNKMQGFKSDDILCLTQEINLANEQLRKMAILYKECKHKDISQGEILLKSLVRPKSAYIDNKASLLRTQAQLPTNDLALDEKPPKSKKKKKKKRKAANDDIKSWIKKNSLKARRLTIEDALSATLVSQKPSYIPVLGKDVLSKVFDEAIPVLKGLNGTERPLHALNPQAIDLNSYEVRLSQWLHEVERKLTSYLLACIPSKERERFETDGLSSPNEYKRALSEIFDDEKREKIWHTSSLLEVQILKGYTYLEQSKEIRNQIKLIETEARESKKEKEKSQTPIKKSRRQTRRCQRVLARHEADGVYYPALVKRRLNARYVNVCFHADGGEQLTSLQCVIAVGGSQPCPLVKQGDFVLARSGEEGDVCYLPSIVQVTPLKMKSSHNFYTLVTFQGERVTCLRKDIVKISREKFMLTTQFIKDKQLQRRKVEIVSEQENSFSNESSTSESDDETVTSFASKEEVVSVHSKQSQFAEEEQRLSEEEEEGEEKEPLFDANEKERDSHLDESREEKEPNLDENVETDFYEGQNLNTDSNDKQSAEVLEAWRAEIEGKYGEKVLELEQQKQALLELTQQLNMLQNSSQQQSQQQMQQQSQQQMQQQQQIQQQIQEQQQEMINQQQRMLQAQINLQSAERMQFAESVGLHEQFCRQQSEQHEQLLTRLLQQQQQQQQQQKVVVKRDVNTNTSDLHQTGVPFAETEMILDDSMMPTDHPLQPSLEDTDEDTRVFLHPTSDALILVHGHSGIFLSRKPLEVDPTVEVRRLPRVLQAKEKIVAKLCQDGFYYKGVVRKQIGDETYEVEDSQGDIYEVERSHIIADQDDVSNLIRTGDYVTGLYSPFHESWAPAIVTSIEHDNSLTLNFYDAQNSVVQRNQVYLISQSKYESDVIMIRYIEDSLIGQVVVARDDRTGCFMLASVKSRVAGSRNYLVEWADLTVAIQNYLHVYGLHSKQQSYKEGDFCLAGLEDKGVFAYLPAKVHEKDGSHLIVKFYSDDETRRVEPAHTFWMSTNSYNRAVEYIKSKQTV